jgi:hypothetical protein
MALHKPAIIVAGMGRCGTSLTMQMLDRAGVPCVGTYPAFESEHTSFNTFDPAFLAALSGKAMKIIDPKRMKIPALTNHVVIWLDRDPKHQSASMAKMIALTGIEPNRAVRRGLEQSLIRDRRPNMRALGAVPMLVASFESLITDTARATGKIADFLNDHGWDIDADVMGHARIVRPVRCLPYMLEERLLLRGAA